MIFFNNACSNRPFWDNFTLHYAFPTTILEDKLLVRERDPQIPPWIKNDKLIVAIFQPFLTIIPSF